MGKRSNIKPKSTVAGRSLLFNSIFVVLNLIAVALVVMGFHPSFIAQSFVLKIIGVFILLASIGGIIVFKGKIALNNVSRVIVGSVFIVSGLIKANDPIGFSYKLEEYFEDGALAFRIKEWFGIPEFSLEGFMPYALILSVVICIIEIVLGVLTIFGQKMKAVSVLLVGMMVFFTFLTWHTANCDNNTRFTDRDRYALNDPIGAGKLIQAKNNPDMTIVSQSGEIIIDEVKSPQCVNDCGCFGDAMKGSVGRSLTPSESLWKDLVLLYFSIWLLLAAFKSNRVEETEKKAFWISSFVLIGFLSWVFGWVFPLIFSLIAFLGTVWFLRKERTKKSSFWISTLFLTILSGLVAFYVLLFLPIKDYRAYAVGNDLKMKMKDGTDGIYQNYLVYKKKDGSETKEYDSASTEYTSSKIWEDESWEYASSRQIIVVPSKLPSITDQFNPFIAMKDVGSAEFALPFVEKSMEAEYHTLYHVYDKSLDTLIGVLAENYDEEEFPINDFKVVDTIQKKNLEYSDIYIREDLFNQKEVIVLVVKNMHEANWSELNKYKEILKLSKQDNIPMIMIVSSSREEVDLFRKQKQFDIPVFINDETEIKAIARSNPSILVIKNGIVKGKYPRRATPDYTWLKLNVLK